MKEKLSFLLFTFWVRKKVFSKCIYYPWLIKQIPGKLSSDKIDAEIL